MLENRRVLVVLFDSMNVRLQEDSLEFLKVSTALEFEKHLKSISRDKLRCYYDSQSNVLGRTAVGKTKLSFIAIKFN